MRIAFIDSIGWDYRIETVYRQPLGGSQSALCYLAQQLVVLGHDIFLLNRTMLPGISCGVFCLNLDSLTSDFLRSMDVVVSFNATGNGSSLRNLLADQTKLLLWTQHGHDQPYVKALQDEEERRAYDGFICVSDWQRRKYCRFFGIDSGLTHVMRNAVAPAFQQEFPPGTPIIKEKKEAPVLAYTSTPFRGLDLLLEAFPRIREQVPRASLKVFSSLKVYMTDEGKDQYQELYRIARATAGVEYVGSLPQPQLAKEMRRVAVLAYPNTFAETSCIAVMEAMASGCRIVTSELGALPETTAGFATLLPLGTDRDNYVERFVAATVTVLNELAIAAPETEDTLHRQVDFVNEFCTWEARAREWESMLTGLGMHGQVSS